MGSASWDLESIASELRRAAFEVDDWPHVLSHVSRAVGGGGALMFHCDDRLAGPLASPDQIEMRDDYLRLGWDKRDERYAGIPIMMDQGVTTDLDFISSEAMRSSVFYQDFLGKRGFGWFAGIGFRAGGDLWCLSLQRTLAQGPFDKAEAAKLKSLWRPFADAATLSRQLDGARYLGITEGLEKIGHAALICDRQGRIVRLNSKAESLVGAMIDRKSGSLMFRDAASRDAYNAVLAAAICRPLVKDTTVASCRIAEKAGRGITFRALPLEGGGPFLAPNGAALLLIARLPLSPDVALATKFNLTRAETKICKALAEGRAVPSIAIAHEVKPESVRTQLKSIYAKTDAHTQGQLVALLAKEGVFLHDESAETRPAPDACRSPNG